MDIRDSLGATHSVDGQTGCAWRNSNYSVAPGEGQFGSGTINLSPAWFQQGHEVCSCLDSHINAVLNSFRSVPLTLYMCRKT